MLALALLGQAATALADGRDVLADAKDNGRIDGCYSRRELNEALDLARGHDQLYGPTVDLITRARITNVARPGGRPVDDDSGPSPGLWLGVVGAVAVVGVGAGVWAERSRRDGGR